jgi:uncharacterized membrane protein
VAVLLRLGTYVAVGLILCGVILMLAGGRSPLDPAPAFDPTRIVDDLIALQPAGFLWLGLLVVLATPAARVALSVAGFVRAGEPRMAGVAVLVLVVIGVGILAGTAGA